MKLIFPLMAIVTGLLIFYSVRMVRLTTAAIGAVLIYGVLGLWSMSRQ